ncbi:hypothetical protein YC2023_012547 [Brassica napus]
MKRKLSPIPPLRVSSSCSLSPQPAVSCQSRQTLPPLLSAVTLSLCLYFCSRRLSLAGSHSLHSLLVDPLLSSSPHRISFSQPVSHRISFSQPVSRRISLLTVVLISRHTRRTSAMSGNDYCRYLSTGSKKSSGSRKSSSRHTNPGSSSNSQMAESSAVPNSQTQASP